METISNEQKAKNMTKGFLKEGLIKKSRLQELLIKAMGWKDKQHAQEKQQWIDKAVEWFGKYLFDIGYPDDWLRDSPNTKNGKTRFIQAMKGEKL